MKNFFLAIVATLIIVTSFSSAKAQLSQPISYGVSNTQVSELQSGLKKLGLFSGSIDGTYEYSTYLSVKDLQSKNGLKPTGYFDLITLNALQKALSGEPKTLSYGITHEKVLELQKYLNALGYLSANPTGFYGSLTTSAISSFQRNIGISSTGITNGDLFSKILQAIDKKFVPCTTYIIYTIKSQDTLWSISSNLGVTVADITKANSSLNPSNLIAGQVVKIPKIVVPVKPCLPKYGEYQDWFSSAQYIFPIGTNATVIDYFTDKSFNIRRTIGAGHADCETVTSSDTAVMKQVFAGTFSWEVRPIILVVNGRRIAASIAGMPHAGLDAYAAGINVNGRSDNYGYGPNYDYIKGNTMNGHFDIHFPGSLRHVDWQLDPRHQSMVNIAANR